MPPFQRWGPGCGRRREPEAPAEEALLTPCAAPVPFLGVGVGRRGTKGAEEQKGQVGNRESAGLLKRDDV